MDLPWETVLQGMRHYFRLQVLGVLVPGALVLLQIGYWALPSVARRSPISLAQYVSRNTADLDGVVLVGTGLIAAFFAYILGFVLRQAVWRVVLRRAHEPSWEEIQGELCEYYNPEAIDATLALHPAINRSEGINALGLRRYAKVWLQQRQPQLAVNFLEAEINIAFANAVPFAGIPFILLSWMVHNPVAYWLAAISASFTIVALLITSGSRLRESTEPYETVFNFLMAHWISEDESPAGPGSALPPNT